MKVKIMRRKNRNFVINGTYRLMRLKLTKNKRGLKKLVILLEEKITI